MTIHASTCDQSIIKKVVLFPIAALAAGVDIADFPVFKFPCAARILEIGVMSQVAPVGIDAGNTSAWLIERGSTAIASRTFAADFPAKGAYASLGAIADLKFAEGDIITYSITNGATANPTGEVLQIEYIPIDDAIFDRAHVV